MGQALVTPGIRLAAPFRPFILHGCRAHAALATWLRHSCRKDLVQAVPELLTRFPCPAMLYCAEQAKAGPRDVIVITLPA